MITKIYTDLSITATFYAAVISQIHIYSNEAPITTDFEISIQDHHYTNLSELNCTDKVLLLSLADPKYTEIHRLEPEI